MLKQKIQKSALYVMALWLHNPGDDILMPMAPTNDNLNTEKAYSEEEFFEALKKSAQSRADFDDTPRNGEDIE